MKQALPGWYVVPIAVVELVPGLKIAPDQDGSADRRFVYAYVTAEARSRFYAAAERCSRAVHRLSEAEARRLALFDQPPPSVRTLFFDDRPYLTRWLTEHRAHAASMTPDRGAAISERLGHPLQRLAWVASPNLRTVYLRLHGRDRSELAFRYCSPFRRADDSELLSFRCAIGAIPTRMEAQAWVPCSEAL